LRRKEGEVAEAASIRPQIRLSQLGCNHARKGQRPGPDKRPRQPRLLFLRNLPGQHQARFRRHWIPETFPLDDRPQVDSQISYNQTAAVAFDYSGLASDNSFDPGASLEFAV